MRQEVIRNRQNCQSTNAMARSQIIQFGRFHLDGQNPMTRHYFVQIGAFIIKNI